MAKRTNAKLIGAFVLGAVALTIGGILAFGGGEYFAQKMKFVVFFPNSSLSGLDVGSAVTFRGVKIGQITSIVIEYNIAHQKLRVPIEGEIDPSKLRFVSGESNPGKNVPVLVAKGLRGQLQTVSLVTGQTTLDFNFYPDTPVRLFGAEPGMLELPTIPSDIELLKANVVSVLAKINKLPLDKLTDELMTTIGDADVLVKHADGVVERGGGLVDNVNGEVKPLATSLIATSDQANSLFGEAKTRLELKPGEPMQVLNETLIDAQRLLNHVDASWPQLAGSAITALKTMTGALTRADSLLKTAQAVLSPASPLYYEAIGTLREIRFAAEAVKVLAEYLQRNPNSILTGNR
jgi:paraquat-inducible protein B